LKHGVVVVNGFLLKYDVVVIRWLGLAGVVVVNGVVVIRWLTVFFSQICKTTTTCEASHHHHQQETHPTGHAAKQRPAHWPNREGETHPAGHAAKHESTIAVVKPAAKPCRVDPNGLEGAVPISA
jgi:hypothetical protein